MKKRYLLTAFILFSIALITSCANYYRKSADKEVYKIIKRKSDLVRGMPSVFTIDIDEETSGIPEKFKSTEPAVISLRESIELGVGYSREYQSRKEALYSKALSVTMARHQFDPIFSGSLAGEIKQQNKTETLTGNFGLGVKQMVATGADISVNLTLNLFRYIYSDAAMKDSSSVFSAAITQPLLKGMGRTVALENLTQSERSMVYSIRDFVRFRRQFSVDIAKEYFNVLNLKEVMNNNLINYQNLESERERAQLLSKAGRLPAFQVDQTEQNELSAKDKWISAKQSYETGLDRFKIRLGLPTEANLELDPNEMKILTEKGPVKIDITLDDALKTALQNRLDLKNIEDSVFDAERKIKVAKNGLLPKADLKFDYSAANTRKNRPFTYRSDSDVVSGGLDIDPVFDKKSERNIYRESLISLNAAKRDFDENKDNIRLEVRNTFREIEQAEKSYIIQKFSVTLAEKRVESTTMLQEAGRASTRDILDAREALLSAKNALTDALVNHFKARLNLFIAMETLKIDDKGIWMEDNKIETKQQ